jgi:hypothetical protein
MPADDVVLVEVEVLRESEKALLVRPRDGDEDVWIPKTQIHEDSEVFSLKSSPGTMMVTRWIAEQKGLV